MPESIPVSKQIQNDVRDARPPVDLEMSVPQRGMQALIMSCIFHAVLLTVIGIMWSRAPKGTGEVGDRPVGIAIVHRMPDRDLYVDTAQVQQASEDQQEQQSSADVASAAAPPADLSPPIDLEGMLKAMEATPAPASGTGLAGETELDGDAFGTDRAKNSTMSGSDTTTMVFGVSGSGSRFIYVFDRSDSMNGFGGKPLRAAKSEMLKSLRSLTEQQQFQIIFYNQKARAFSLPGMPMQMVSGSDPNVARAERYVDSIRAYGGTGHVGALKLALRMAPDVVFFLTDAHIPRMKESELFEVRRRAEQAGTTIHAIEFGPDPVAPHNSFLPELAKQNNGQYQYVNIRGLKAGPVPTKDKATP